MTDIFVSNNPPATQTTTAPNAVNNITSPVADPPKRIHALSSFCPDPIGVSFKEQDPDEKILLFLRKHFITNVPWIVYAVILFLLPDILRPINAQLSIADLSSFPSQLNSAVAMFYYLAVFAYAFANFITWYFNISLVTTKRVVDIDYSDIVYKNVSATKLSLVQDVSFVQIGVIPSIFDYGDVLVQTAGALDNFDFFKVPHPEKVVNIIEDLIGKKRS